MNSQTPIAERDRRRRARIAFTLVELVIVLTMIPIVMGAVTLMIIQMRTRGDRLTGRIAQQEQFARAGDQWRLDVLTARTIAIGEAGGNAALTALAPDGRTHYIAWQRDDDGRLVRLAGPQDGSETASRSVLLEASDRTRFVRQGDAWALTWTARPEGRLDRAPIEATAWASPARPLGDAGAAPPTPEAGGIAP